MDENTALVLALQLVALFSIAGALLLYLLCKIRGGGSDLSEGGCPGAGKPVLVTSADNAIGLQIAVHLANRGFRVFAGLKNGASSGSNEDSPSARIIRAWQKHKESSSIPGILIALPLEVTREDLLHEAADLIRAHLPAGEDGIWAVINTSGSCYRGKLEQQDVAHWEATLKTNVLGVLRTARKFRNLLRNAGGRIVTVGATERPGAGLVAYAAGRWAVEGASRAMRQELAPLGIKVVAINPQGVMPELLFAAPKMSNPAEQTETSVDISGHLEFQPVVLSARALRVLDIALTTRNPKTNYNLEDKRWYGCLECLKIV